MARCAGSIRHDTAGGVVTAAIALMPGLSVAILVVVFLLGLGGAIAVDRILRLFVCQIAAVE